MSNEKKGGKKRKSAEKAAGEGTKDEQKGGKTDREGEGWAEREGKSDGIYGGRAA